jgi:hypothetical protein
MKTKFYIPHKVLSPPIVFFNWGRCPQDRGGLRGSKVVYDTKVKPTNPKVKPTNFWVKPTNFQVKPTNPSPSLKTIKRAENREK